MDAAGRLKVAEISHLFNRVQPINDAKTPFHLDLPFLYNNAGGSLHFL